MDCLVHTLHMPEPNVTHVQRATQWTVSVHTSQMPIPTLTRVQSATQWTASLLFFYLDAAWLNEGRCPGGRLLSAKTKNKVANSL